jgi:hypothetical protein
MDREVRRKLDTADNVLSFNEANPPPDAAAKVVFDALAARVAEAKTTAATERSGLATERAGVARRKAVRVELQRGLLGYLVRIGEAVAEEVPELALKFKLPSLSATNRTYLTAATSMYAEANVHREAFVRHGLSDELFAELGAMLDQYAKAVELAANGRRQHVGARADLDAIGGEITVLLEKINRLNQHRFRNDPDRLAGWDSARNVRRSARSQASRPPDAPPPVQPPVAPPPDSDQAA